MAGNGRRDWQKKKDRSRGRTRKKRPPERSLLLLIIYPLKPVWGFNWCCGLILKHTDTNTSGSLLAAVHQLNWLQRSGGSAAFPPGIIQSARAAVAGRQACQPTVSWIWAWHFFSYFSPSRAHCHALKNKLKSKSKRQGVSTVVGQINTVDCSCNLH